MRRWLWVLQGLVGALLTAAYLLLDGLAAEAAYIAVPGAAGLAMLGFAWSASSRGRSVGRPFFLFGLGLLASTAGEVLWVSYELRGLEPFPSWADVWYLASYPLHAAALVTIVRRRSADGGRGSIIDACILATSAALAAWVYLMAPLAGDTEAALAAKIFSLAYPSGGILLLGLSARLLLTPGARTGAFRLLVAAFGTTLVADVVYGWQVVTTGYEGGWVDVGWLAGYTLLGMAGLHRSAPALMRGSGQVEQPPTARRMAVLAGATLIAPAMLLGSSLNDRQVDLAVIAAGSAALFGLVMVRMTGLVRQVQRQAEQLDLLSRTDPLTGALNRRALEDRLDEELARSRREGRPLALAVLDLDHFKRFNDANGHQAGDRVLVEAVAAWSQELRAIDVLARFGGEEFIVLLPGCTIPEAVAVLERLRRATPQAQTCSVGVAAWDGAEDGEALFGRADVLLYAAKEAGRDRVVADDHPVGAAP